jgi:hypothetical protein
MSVQVYDDILTDEESKELESRFIQIPWFLSTADNYASVTKNVVEQFSDKNTIEPPQMTNFLFNNGRQNSQHWVHAAAILDKFCSKTGIKIKSLFRCKANLSLQSNATTTQYMTPHYDSYENHKVLIYYVNDSDGATITFDENREVVDIITAMRGRFVLFDGKTLHCGQPPIQNKVRIVLNYNFL